MVRIQTSCVVIFGKLTFLIIFSELPGTYSIALLDLVDARPVSSASCASSARSRLLDEPAR